MERAASITASVAEPVPGSGDVTRWLERWAAGDADAVHQLLPRVYGELRRIAGALARGEPPDATLQATALVHEAYLVLFAPPAGRAPATPRSHAHLLSTAARVMRHLLVDHGRRRRAVKRGGDRRRLDVEGLDLPAARAPEVAAVDDALRALERLDARAARLVELRFFAGLPLEQAAACLGISRRTAVRRWRRARAWLHAELAAGGGGS